MKLLSIISCLIYLFYSSTITNPPTGKISYIHLTHFTNDDNSKNGEAVLLFNEKESVYLHKSAPKKNSIQNDGDKVTPIAGDEEGFPVYKNLKSKDLVYKELLGLTPKQCIVKDTLPTINWKITKKTKEIGSFKCQQAVGDFAGRTYNAWFTLDIPVSSGPYKLHGLPGLILEAKSVDGKVEFLFSSVEISKNIKEQIIIPNKGIVFESFDAYKKASDKQIEDTIKRFKAKGINFNVKTNEPDSKIEIRND